MSRAAPPAHVKGKVLGFRQWTLEGYKLRSAAVPEHWTIGENKARCVSYISGSGHHEAPHPSCECGLYAWHEPHAFPYDATCAIFGAVLAWGRIEVHASGFRAEYAEPVMLAYSKEQPYGLVENARMIAGEMGIPFVEISELEARARELGDPIAPELRPRRPPVPRLSPRVGVFGGGTAGAAVATAAPAGHPGMTGAMLMAANALAAAQHNWSQVTMTLPAARPRRSWPLRLTIAANLAGAGANIGIGIIEGTWWSFVIAGFGLAVAHRAGRRPKRP